MKTVYFVRHGETANNAANAYNTLETPISPIGREQAEVVAKRCVQLPIETIISSTLIRAKETAEIIAIRTGCTMELSDLFRERGTPKAILGRVRGDKDAVEYERAWWAGENAEIPLFADGETFEAMRDRVAGALEFLEKRSEQEILVVTHGFFLVCLLAYVVFGRELSGSTMMLIRRAFSMENVGITVVQHAPREEARTNWRVWIWNDHAHLG